MSKLERQSIQSLEIELTYSDTGKVGESPHLHSAISRRRGKALVDWRELDTPDATSVTGAHTDQRQISYVPNLRSAYSHFTTPVERLSE